MRNIAPLLATLAAAITLAGFVAVSQGRAASTAGITPLEVSAADITQAGYTRVTPLTPTADRWLLPIHYFTVRETIPRTEAKNDCDDCGNVVAVYAAVTPSVPGWSINQHTFIRKVAGRWQGRSYLPNKKTVIVVTGPEQTLITKLLNQLKTKFGA